MKRLGPPDTPARPIGRPLHFPPGLLRALRAGRLRVPDAGKLQGRALPQITVALHALAVSIQRRLLRSWISGEDCVSVPPPLASAAPWNACVRERSLPAHAQALLVTVIGRDRYGRRHWMLPSAAHALARLRAAAGSAGIELETISSFRSVRDQQRILDRKLARGQSWADILAVNAPPGYSEHHSGRAVDFAVPGAEPLTENYQSSTAFGWLRQHACGFGFRLSYPRDNPLGFIYEPWHWYFEGSAQ